MVFDLFYLNWNTNINKTLNKAFAHLFKLYYTLLKLTNRKI